MMQVCKRFFCVSGFKNVQNYNPKIDAADVREIAIKNMSKLVSIDMTPSNPAKDRDVMLFESEVLPVLESDDVTKKVIRINDQVVGFITYHTENCWHGAYARIEHLAVSDFHQKKGYGNELLKVALKDLRKQKIDVVSLDITSNDLAQFYARHDFKVLKHVNIKYANAGHMALNLRKGQGNLVAQCLGSVRMRRRLFPKYVYALFLLGVMSVCSSSTAQKERSAKH